MKNNKKKKVLIIRFSSIGDIVLTSPVIRCLKTQTNAEVHFLTKNSYSAIVENNPYIDKVFYLQGKLMDIIPLLKDEKYDFVVDLHNNIRSTLVKLHLRVNSSSFQKLNLRKWLLVNFKKDILPKKHIVDRYLECVADLGVKNDGNGLDYFIPPGDEISRSALPGEFQKGYIGLVIGAKFATKKLPGHKLRQLLGKLDFPVVLLGGPHEKEIGEDLVKSFPGKAIFNGCGKYNLNQSASLVKHSNLIITHDTGMMHIAAAFNKKIISIWGNTVPEFGMYPYFSTKHPGENKAFEIKDLPCRPCSKIGFDKCPKKHFLCMEAHNENEIADVSKRLFGQQT